MINGGYLGNFFQAMFAEMEIENQKRANKESGIELSEKGLFGVPNKNIPSIYHSINFKSNHYICIKGDSKTLYDNNGSFMFSFVDFENLGENMFLVKENPEENYCLYRGYEKLSKPIFKSTIFSKFKGDFGIVSITDKKSYGSECLIDKNGNVLLRGETFNGRIHLYNNVAESNNKFYNLLDGCKVICDKKHSYEHTLEADEFIFVQVDKCVYKINTITAEYEITGTPPPPKEESPKPNITKKTPPPTKPSEKQQGRNELCNCGSDKKFKNCCIKKQ